MLSNFAVGLVAGLGFGGWVYGKTMHHNGGQTQQALLVAAISGVVAAILVGTLLSIFFSS